MCVIYTAHFLSTAKASFRVNESNASYRSQKGVTEGGLGNTQQGEVLSVVRAGTDATACRSNAEADGNVSSSSILC